MHMPDALSSCLGPQPPRQSLKHSWTRLAGNIGQRVGRRIARRLLAASLKPLGNLLLFAAFQVFMSRGTFGTARAIGKPNVFGVGGVPELATAISRTALEAVEHHRLGPRARAGALRRAAEHQRRARRLEARGCRRSARHLHKRIHVGDPVGLCLSIWLLLVLFLLVLLVLLALLVGFRPLRQKREHQLARAFRVHLLHHEAVVTLEEQPGVVPVGRLAHGPCRHALPFIHVQVEQPLRRLLHEQHLQLLERLRDDLVKREKDVCVRAEQRA
mmetsp:Transcript_8500/g.19903  ORF Transcript_8500/g.19903 Transcript_8500/m.19903 type:complete len:272 (+) Transcript_8500:103-918(+)